MGGQRDILLQSKQTYKRALLTGGTKLWSTSPTCSCCSYIIFKPYVIFNSFCLLAFDSDSHADLYIFVSPLLRNQCDEPFSSRVRLTGRRALIFSTVLLWNTITVSFLCLQSRRKYQNQPWIDLNSKHYQCIQSLIAACCLCIVLRLLKKTVV